MNDEDAADKFSKEYVVEKRLVTQYVTHLRELERKKNKRMESRKRANLEEREKGFEDYKWEDIYREGKLGKLKVAVLDLYIAKRKLKHSKGALKQEKVDVVTVDIARSLVQAHCNDDRDDYYEDDKDDYGDDVDDNDGSEDEAVVTEEIGSDDDKSEEDDDKSESEAAEEESVLRLLQVTRSGRTCRTWRGRAAADFF